jgi:hypothetical protein
MPSEEQDSRATDLNSAINNARECLLQMADAHRTLCGEDSFYFFLKIHECIFDRVDNHPSVSVRELNLLFASRCIQVYEDYRNNKVHLLSKRWVTAFLAYQKDRHAFFNVLPLMALAHILDDLEAILAQVDVNKDDYDLVLDDIVACLETVENPLNAPTGLKQQILSFLQKRLGSPTIAAMREIAWRQSLRRKALKRR